MRRIAIAATLCMTGCANDNGDTFDRRQLLEDLADHVILPEYQSFHDESAALADATQALCDAPSDTTLAAAQEAWRSTRSPWQRAVAFGFGPVADLRIDSAVDFWPVRTEDIDAELAATATIDDPYVDTLGTTRKGMPVIEYLLFSDPAADFDGTRRCEYAAALARDVAQQAEALQNEWTGGFTDELVTAGNGSIAYPKYRDVFTAIVNQLIATAQTVESDKLGKPLGRQDGGVVQPDSVDAPYSDNSLTELLDNVEGIRAVYTSGSKDNLGLDDALGDIAPDLRDTVDKQLETTKKAIAAIPPPLRDAVTSDPDSVQAAFDASKELLRLLGADVAGALGTTTTFSPNDGD